MDFCNEEGYHPQDDDLTAEDIAAWEEEQARHAMG